MTWADAIPNLLIGLREGLEGGLVVTILLAALRKTAPGRSTFPIWAGVAGAISISASSAAVLTFSTGALDSAAQEAVGGLLSVLAVVLVTAMVFWMRRTASHLSGDLRAKVGQAAIAGAGALAVTAFVAVGREGLETTLFIWTAVKASGSTVAPVAGALVGIVVAVVLCALLFRGAIRIDLGVFFSRTALALLVIAAGILSYGLGDLQDAGLLPGQTWIVFDFSGTAAAGTWWVSLISGITELQTRMTVLSVAAWVGYLAIVLPLFLRRPASAPTRTARSARIEAPSESPRDGTATPSPPRAAFERLLAEAERRTAAVVVGIVLVPAMIAAGVIAALPANAQSVTAVTVGDGGCGAGWSSGRTGEQTFSIRNTSTRVGEINLDDATGGVVAEVETLGPGTTAVTTATLGTGTYTFHCYFAGRAATTGAAVQVTGARPAGAPASVVPPTVAELTPANDAYQKQAAAALAALQADLAALATAAAAGDTTGARADWLAAQLDWERVGASYDSFGDLGEAVDALPIQFERGAADPGFTGLHRVEYDLWQGASAATTSADIATTQAAVAQVVKHLSSDDLAGDPTNLPIRAHEIIEDALRDHLAVIDDEGSGAGYAMTWADTQIDAQVITDLRTPIERRAPHLVAQAQRQLAALQTALLSLRASDGTWVPPETASLAQRQRVDAATGALLETLARIPDLLEVPPSQQ